ncbi:MAG: molybdopterin dinucleotide binding domain-containing protein [Candidatus Asgardarchaeia archaeon]
MIEVTLITGRTLTQGMLKENKKFSREYYEDVAVCFLSPNNMKTLDVKDDDTIELETKDGSIVVFVKSDNKLSDNEAFMPYSIWANMLIGSKTNSIGMPSFKSIKVKIKKSEKPVPEAIDLLNRYIRRY